MKILITDATIITVDNDHQIFSPGAILIENDRIAALGPVESVEAVCSDIDRRIVASGKLVLPGFISTHNHLGYSVFRGRAEDIGHRAVRGLYIPMSVVLSRDERAALANLSAAELLRGGVTTVLQMEEDADVSAPFVEKVGLRAKMGIMAHDIDVDRLNSGEIFFDESVRADQLEQSIGFAESIHGRANGRLEAVMSVNTTSTASPALLRALKDTAQKMDINVSIHLGIGEEEDTNATHGTSSFNYARDHGFLDEKTIAVHCYAVNEKDVALLSQSGASLAHCPLMNQFRGAIAPVDSMLAKGVRVGLGIDNYFSDYFEVMRACVAVARVRANDPAILKAPEVLARATIDSARVIDKAQELGSLVIGKKADLQVVNTHCFGLTPINDPVRTLVYHGHGKDVDLVMVDGRIVVENGELCEISQDDLVEEAAKAAEAAWTRFSSVHGGYAATETHVG